MMRCSVASARVNSPVRRPSHRTRIRSHSVSSSGSSLEVTMMPRPCAAKLVHQPIQLGLGADVDAARRIVEQQHLGLGEQPAADDAFCWLPPLRLVIGASMPAVLTASRATDVAGHAAASRRRLTQAGAWPLRERAERDVLRRRSCRRTGPAACGLRSPAPCRRAMASAGMAKRDLAAVEHDPPARRLGAGAEQAFQQLGPAGPHQPGDAQDLAAPQRKRDVLQPPAAGMARPGQREVLDRQHHLARPRAAPTGRSPRSRGRPSGA